MAEAKGFRVLGKEIELDIRGGKRVELRPDMVVVSDPNGQFFPRCHVFLVRALHARHGVRDEPERSFFRAMSWHNATKWPYNAHVQIPRGPWKRFGVVDWIGYRRSDLGPMSHDFEKTVSLYLMGDVAGYLKLPAGCILNERGFVYP